MRWRLLAVAGTSAASSLIQPARSIFFSAGSRLSPRLVTRRPRSRVVTSVRRIVAIYRARSQPGVPRRAVRGTSPSLLVYADHASGILGRFGPHAPPTRGPPPERAHTSERPQRATPGPTGHLEAGVPRQDV